MELPLTDSDIALLKEKLSIYNATKILALIAFPFLAVLCMYSWLSFWHDALIFFSSFFLLACSVLLIACIYQQGNFRKDLDNGIKIKTQIRVSSKEIGRGNELITLSDDALQLLLEYKQNRERGDKTKTPFGADFQRQLNYIFMIAGKDENNTFVRYRIPLEYFVNIREGQSITLYYTPHTATVLDVSVN